MIVIESATIRYFRSAYTVTLGPCKDLTVITGKNDVGKSNILKALNLFFCQQTDYSHNFDFFEDYSIIRKEEVRKDTIRGQQFISITVWFRRGDKMPNSLPPRFSVTKRWDMHSSECKVTSDAQARMKVYAKKHGLRYSDRITATSLSTFLNRIKFIYIPAIKDERVFEGSLNILQESLFASKNKQILDAPIGEANKAVQNILGELQHDFEASTGIKNFVALPNTLNYTSGLLQVNTQTAGGSVAIDRRGDGIRSHYIPKILNYVAMHSNHVYIWGFEEPENSYEYRRCIQVANEFSTCYCTNSQIFITSHSPAFIGEDHPDKKVVMRIGSREGKTIVLNNDNPLDEELGYIEIYRDFIEAVKSLQKKNSEQENEVTVLRDTLRNLSRPIVFTEGKTDAKLMKIATDKLNKDEELDFRAIDLDGTSNNEVLLKFLKGLKSNINLSMPVIGMFDRDTKLNDIIDGETVDIRDKRFVKFAKNIYAFAIPVPHDRQEVSEISIEHYFTDDEIKTDLDGKRLFIGNEFYPTGVHKQNGNLFYKGAKNVAGTIKIIEHETKNYVMRIDGQGDYSLSKAHFVDAISEGKEKFSDFSFEEFKKIFDIIDEILQDSKEIS